MSTRWTLFSRWIDAPQPTPNVVHGHQARPNQPAAADSCGDPEHPDRRPSMVELPTGASEGTQPGADRTTAPAITRDTTNRCRHCDGSPGANTSPVSHSAAGAGDHSYPIPIPTGRISNWPAFGGRASSWVWSTAAEARDPPSFNSVTNPYRRHQERASATAAGPSAA